MPPKRKQASEGAEPVPQGGEGEEQDAQRVEAEKKEKKRRVVAEEEEDERTEESTETDEKEEPKGKEEQATDKGKEHEDSHASEPKQVAQLDEKVQMLVSEIIKTDNFKPVLFMYFNACKWNEVRGEVIEKAIEALNTIYDECSAPIMTNASKLNVIRQTVNYFENVPWIDGGVVYDLTYEALMSKYWTLLPATKYLRNYITLREMSAQFPDPDALIARCYEDLLSHDVSSLAKNTDEYRTILQYLAQTNDSPRVSLQVKQVFVIKERAIRATTRNTPFETEYKDTKRLLLWRGVPHQEILHTLTDGVVPNENGYYAFYSHFGHASALISFGPQENACMMLAEVAVGDLKDTYYEPPVRETSSPYIPIPDTAEISNHVCARTATAAEYEQDMSPVRTMSDGVIVPQGAFKSPPLTAPAYYAPSRQQFRLRYLVVADFLKSETTATSTALHSLMAASPLAPSTFTPSFSLLSSPPSLNSSLSHTLLTPPSPYSSGSFSGPPPLPAYIPPPPMPTPLMSPISMSPFPLAPAPLSFTASPSMASITSMPMMPTTSPTMSFGPPTLPFYEWDFYKPENDTWEAFGPVQQFTLEDYYLKGPSTAVPILGTNGVAYNVDQVRMVQYRVDNPDRVRRVRRRPAARF